MSTFRSMSYGKHLRKLSLLSMALTLGWLFTPAVNLSTRAVGQLAYAQGNATPASGNIYVLSNGEWREAFVQLATGRISQGRPAWSYTIQYLDGNREVETNVTEDRVRTPDQLVAGDRDGAVTGAPIYDLASQAGIDQMLDAHNRVRRDVGVRELLWSSDLASRAQSWADTLIAENRFAHSPANLRNNGDIGENVTRKTNSGGAYSTPAQAIAGWAAERHSYDYASNSCVAGQRCGHYTQMVWADTTEVGCGVARTDDARREIWVCQYNPGGNFVGQRPY